MRCPRMDCKSSKLVDGRWRSRGRLNGILNVGHDGLAEILEGYDEDRLPEQLLISPNDEL